MNKILIEVIKKLQEVFGTVGVDTVQLPQIVAIGEQSGGKSSIIESIVGRSFLPRGTGIVTRCPLILQLIHSEINDPEHRSKLEETLELEQFGKFLHTKKVFTEFDEICTEIEHRTEELAGSNKGICDKPITLRIYSKNVLTLTLVDLPGFTKVPVGDQPENIEQQIKELAIKYIGNPNSIILAVTAANTDIATSDALKYAKAVDPEGARTLAVLTKLDLIDAGTDAKEMLSGQVIPVELGIIGVVNRSQQDINDKKGIADSLKNEAGFLQRKYPTLAAINGTPYLSKILNQLLIKHIHDNLPDLSDRVRAKMTENEKLLEEYGEKVTDKGRTRIQIISKFSDAYNASIEENIKNIGISDFLGGGADIYCICFEIYKSFLDSIDPTSEMNEKDIWTAAKYASGVEPPIFVYENAFKHMIRNQISRFKCPTISCLDLVHEKMLDLIQQCCSNELHLEMERFPKMNSKISSIITTILRDCAATTKKMLEHQLDMEKTYINTQHEDFRQALMELQSNEDDESVEEEYQNTIRLLKIKKPTKDVMKVQNPPVDNSSDIRMVAKTKDMVKKRMANHQLTPNEKEEIKNIKFLINSYYDIIKKKLLDSIPKTIMHFLVYAAKNKIKEELIHKMCIGNDMDDLLFESGLLTVKRHQAKQTFEDCVRANQIISEVRDTKI